MAAPTKFPMTMGNFVSYLNTPRLYWVYPTLEAAANEATAGKLLVRSW